jgi:signal transduction histidine kinase/CheY-like chemotaxis protein/CHASE3 domain sensor protein
MGRRGRSLRFQLVLVLSIVLVTVWVGVLLSVRALDDLRQELRDSAHRGDRLAVASDEVLRLVVDLESGQRAFALTGDPRFLAPHDAASAQLPVALDRLRSSAAGFAGAADLVARIQGAVDRWHREADPVIGLARESATFPERLDQARAYVLAGRGKAIIDGVRVDVAALREIERSLTLRALTGLDANRDRLQTGLLITAVLASLVAFGAGLVVAQRLQVGIDRLVAAARRIAARRFEPVPVESGDLRALSAAMDTAAGMLASAERLDRVLLDAGMLCARGLDLPVLLAELQGILERAVPVFSLSLTNVLPGGLVERAAAHPAGLVPVGEASRQPVASAGLLGRAVLERRVVIDNEAGTGDGARAERMRELGVTALAAVPLIVEDEVFGVLALARAAPATFAPEHAPFLATLGTQIAGALHTAELYRRLAARNAELEQASRAKSDFLAMMSHELRTPLNAVIGFAEVLANMRLGALGERQQRYVANIHTSGRHLLGVINDLLDFSRVEAGKMQITRGIVSPAAVVVEATEELAELAARKRQVVVAHVAEDTPDVIGDPQRIRQALTNLVGNAIKFTPTEGRIAIDVTAVDGGRRVRFAVADNGPGVPPEQRGRLFTPFTQLEHQRSGGTGLGLALTRQLVELMLGTVELDGEHQPGARFWFDLPAAARVPSAVHGSANLAVIVEDDPYAIELLDLTLREAGYETVVANDGARALELVAAHKPALVTLDVYLPTVDGWEVLRRLRADAATEDVPVLIVSVSSDQARSRRLGVVDHVVKPFAREALLAAVRRAGRGAS